jgi:hypothetical protein
MWVSTALMLAISARAIAAAGIRRPRHRQVAAFIGAIVLLWVPGYVLTEIIPVPAVILAEPFRGTRFAVLIGLLYLGHHQVLRFSTGRTLQVVTGLSAVAIPVALWLSVPLAASLAVPHLVTPVRDDRAGSPARWAGNLAYAGLLVLLLVGAGARIVERAEADWTQWWGGMASTWSDVQLWVRDNTAPDAMVMVPPSEKGFRVLSERPIVGDWKDGGSHQNNPENMVAWWQRMQDLGYTATGPISADRRDFRSFDATELQDIAIRYDADLLITYSDHDLPWTPTYCNDDWAVYELSDPVGAPNTARWR